jgi:hypothetical protein
LRSIRHARDLLGTGCHSSWRTIPCPGRFGFPTSLAIARLWPK